VCFVKIGAVQNKLKCVSESFVVFFFYIYIFLGPIWRKFTIGSCYKILLSVNEPREKRGNESHTLLKVFMAFLLYFLQILDLLRDI